MANAHLYNANPDPDLRLRGSKYCTLLKIYLKFWYTSNYWPYWTVTGYLPVLKIVMQDEDVQNHHFMFKRNKNTRIQIRIPNAGQDPMTQMNADSLFYLLTINKIKFFNWTPTYQDMQHCRKYRYYPDQRLENQSKQEHCTPTKKVWSLIHKS